MILFNRDYIVESDYVQSKLNAIIFDQIYRKSQVDCGLGLEGMNSTSYRRDFSQRDETITDQVGAFSFFFVKRWSFLCFFFFLLRLNEHVEFKYLKRKSCNFQCLSCTRRSSESSQAHLFSSLFHLVHNFFYFSFFLFLYPCSLDKRKDKYLRNIDDDKLKKFVKIVRMVNIVVQGWKRFSLRATCWRGMKVYMCFQSVPKKNTDTFQNDVRISRRI